MASSTDSAAANNAALFKAFGEFLVEKAQEATPTPATADAATDSNTTNASPALNLSTLLEKRIVNYINQCTSTDFWAYSQSEVENDNGRLLTSVRVSLGDDGKAMSVNRGCILPFEKGIACVSMALFTRLAATYTNTAVTQCGISVNSFARVLDGNIYVVDLFAEDNKSSH